MCWMFSILEANQGKLKNKNWALWIWMLVIFSPFLQSTANSSPGSSNKLKDLPSNNDGSSYTTNLINQPLQQTPKIIHAGSGLVYGNHSDAKPIGSALFIKDIRSNKRRVVALSNHVFTKICNNTNSQTIHFTFPVTELKAETETELKAETYANSTLFGFDLNCTEFLILTNQDVALALLSSEELQAFPEYLLSNTPHFKEIPSDSHYKKHPAEVYCHLSLNKNGESTKFFFSGDYLDSFTENIPGCSGSGLFMNNFVIGIMRGFRLNSKLSIYVPLERSWFEQLDRFSKTRPTGALTETRRAKPPTALEAARGDPLDGGNNSHNSHFVLVMPKIKTLAHLATSRRIMHIPEEGLQKNWISPQLDTYYYPKKGILNCSGDLSHFHKSATKSIPKELVHANWPIDPYIYNSGYEIQFRVKLIAKKPQTNTKNTNTNADADAENLEYQYIFQPINSNRPHFTHAFRNHNSSEPLIHVATDNWALTLEPGLATIKEYAFSAAQTTLNDPNPCYRSFFIKDSGSQQIALYNVGISLFAASKTDYFYEIQISRALGRSKAELLKGNIIEYEFLIAAIKSTEWKVRDWQ